MDHNIIMFFILAILTARILSKRSIGRSYKFNYTFILVGVCILLKSINRKGFDLFLLYYLLISVILDLLIGFLKGISIKINALKNNQDIIVKDTFVSVILLWSGFVLNFFN